MNSKKKKGIILFVTETEILSCNLDIAHDDNLLGVDNPE